MSSTSRVQQVPRLNANDNTVEILHFYFNDGDYVKKGSDLVDVGTSKASVTVTSEHDGFVRYTCRLRDFVRVGSPFASFFEKKELMGKAVVGVPAGAANYSASRVSNAAHAYATENGLEIPEGTGLWTTRRLRGGRHAEVDSAQEPREISLDGVARSERLSKAKMFEVDNLRLGQEGLSTSSLTIEFSAAGVLKALKESGSMSRSLLPLTLYQMGRVLPEFPRLTAFFGGGQIHYYDRRDVGVALDMGKGLRVVVLRQVDKLLPAEIQEKVTDFALRYATDDLTIEEMQNSTITVSDLTSQNIRSFRPLLNARQSAILGIGGDMSAADAPMTFTMTFDHRVSTGFEVAQFLNKLKQGLLSFNGDKA